MTAVVIGLSGKAKSGKNSTVHLTRAKLDDYRDPPVLVRSVSFADPLKEMARAMAFEVGLTAEDIDNKTPLGRKFLQDLGMGKRKEDPLYWVKKAAVKIERIARDPRVKVIFVPDVRFLNEAEFIRSRGWELWRVSRPIVAHLQMDQHTSEVELDDYDGFDAHLTANTMTELFEVVTTQLKRLGLV